MKIIRRVYDWMGSKVGTRHADAWLIFLFFAESSFFIIPVDPMLILYCIHQRTRAFYYATVTTISSVVGGWFGYAIGALMWETLGSWLVEHLITPSVFASVVAKYKLYQHWVVFAAAFTPLPYKAVTISAGFCHLDLTAFTIMSILGRGGRFFLVSAAIYYWGDKIQHIIDRFFNYLVVAFIALFVLSIKIFFK